MSFPAGFKISRMNRTLLTAFAVVIAMGLGSGRGGAGAGTMAPGAPFESEDQALAVLQVANVPGGATFIVTYTGFSPAAQEAFQRAVDTWAATISSHVPIRIDARWEPQGQDALGEAAAVSFYKDLANAPRPGAWFKVALANSILGSDHDPGQADILATFNSENPDFYFVTRSTPAGQFHCPTVDLH